MATKILNISLATKQELGDLKSADKKRWHTLPPDDKKIDEFIAPCFIKIIPLPIERFETEKLLIQKLTPELNKRDNN